MKISAFVLSLFIVAPCITSVVSANAQDSKLVILDDAGVKNLRIESHLAEEADFEQSIFALGRIDVYPGRRAMISSRIAGRALEVFVKHDHPIEKGEPAVVIESRQPGDPPPTVIASSPITGLVSATFIAPGEPVSPDKVLAEVLDLSEVYAIARVPEHLAGRLKKGQIARIHVPAVPDENFEAHLEHLGAMADAESGTVEAAFHVLNPRLSLRPGMRAEFSIVVDRRENVLSIPRAALQGDEANRFVYVKDFDLPNAFLKTPVVVGEVNDRVVEIKSGLLPADEVVTRGAYSLAFAGGSGISLKEALDAAHGHEHNEDGSEITANQKKSASVNETSDGRSGSNPIWMIISGILFVALVLSSLRKKRKAPDVE